MPMNSLNSRRVAILEDDPVNRERWTSMITMCGGIPLPVIPHAPALDELETYLQAENAAMVMCDNRLFEHGSYANYYGAQAIAASYRCGRGGVLITAYENYDVELSIREFRRWIPSLIHATALKRNVLEAALIEADREVQTRTPSCARTPYRTVMTIRDIVQNGLDKIVKVTIGQWKSSEEVGFPLKMLPEHIRNDTVPGNMLIAEVNIAAVRSEDLYFDKFELPNPDVLKKSQALFGHS